LSDPRKLDFIYVSTSVHAVEVSLVTLVNLWADTPGAIVYNTSAHSSGVDPYGRALT
jgi:hypothetical protein